MSSLYELSFRLRSLSARVDQNLPTIEETRTKMIWLELTSAWSKCSWICSVREYPRFSSTVQSRYSLCHCPLIVDCNRVVLITTSLPLQQSRKAIPFGMRRRISRNDLLSSSYLCIQSRILAHDVDTDITDACNIYILILSYALSYSTERVVELHCMT